MNYKIIARSQANELKLKDDTRFIMTIESNLASVYQIWDSSYLVMPINPFAKCLWVKDKSLLDKWINEKYFPTEEKENMFYFQNKDKIDNLLLYRQELKEDLFKYIYPEADTKNIVCTSEEIDRIYKLLRQKRKFEKYKLQFIVLIGDFLSQKYPNEKCRWGLFESKQLLNPVVNLVLIKEANGILKYFKLEEMISGKWGYEGMQSIEFSIKQYWLLPTEIDVIKKVM